MKKATAEKVYVTLENVEFLMGCKHATASKILKDVNEYAAEKGYHSFPSGKANKYLFAERYGIPQEVVNAAINS